MEFSKYINKIKKKKFYVCFFIFIAVIVAGISLFESNSPCTIDTLPFQYDDKGPIMILSEVEPSSRRMGFLSFCEGVTKHLEAKLAQEKICLNNAASKERSLLQITSVPVHIWSASEYSLPSLQMRPNSSGCRISSPWVELVVEREPVPWVRGIFRYNKRQVLIDQAMLAGALNVPPGVAMPLTDDEYMQYVEEYVSTEISHQPAEKPIEERVPPDLLWLFHRVINKIGPYFRGDSSDFVSLSTYSADKAMAGSYKGYTKLVITLIDRCFESEGVELHYNSILEIDDPILLDQYRIIVPIVVFDPDELVVW